MSETSSPKPCGLDAASGKYHVGCGVIAPTVTFRVEPNFSEKARKQKIMGIVLVGLTVDADGNPSNVHVFRSAADRVDKKHRDAALSLDQNALESVQKYRFTPASYQGKAVPVDLIVEVNFEIF
jgi:TonB family protein